MSAQQWADHLLALLKRDLHGHLSGPHRISLQDHAFVSARPDGDVVAVQVGDLDTAVSDFERWIFNPGVTSIVDAARHVLPLIRCIQWLEASAPR
ncbi:MAG: hypothetical protein M3Z37_11145 [Candidatus Eremiobacteraeota bacterium]|nr:hypothetical protein [Candidatus Eremiobacteraeota bacterium]